MTIRIELAERSLQLLHCALGEVAREVEATKDQIERAELTAQWRFLIGKLADIVIESDDALYHQTRTYMQVVKRPAD